MARKSAGRSNGRDSNPKYLGVKSCEAFRRCTIIVDRGAEDSCRQQRGLGRDHTLFALMMKGSFRAQKQTASVYSE